MEPEGSLPRSQQLVTGPYPESNDPVYDLKHYFKKSILQISSNVSLLNKCLKICALPVTLEIDYFV
jgi:hypothetical protein